MKQLKDIKELLYFAIIALVITISCSCNLSFEKRQTKRQILYDSTSIYSLNPNKPFKYGYAYSSKISEQILVEEFDFYDLKNGETVADVGASSGWLMGLLSLKLDSVNFYIQDIDTNFLTEIEMQKMVNYYTNIRNRPQTNKFNCVIGSDRSTNLPDTTFDKIIINNTMHEFTYLVPMIKDVSDKLKNNGKLIIGETFSTDEYTIKHTGCNIPCGRLKPLINYLQWGDLYLTGLYYPEGSSINYLILEKNKLKAELYKKKCQEVEIYINEIKKLNKLEIIKDSRSVAKIEREIITHLDTILTVYNSLDEFLNTIGYTWMKKGNYKAAIKVFEINLKLYPNFHETYVNLSESKAMVKKHKEAYDLIIKYEMAELRLGEKEKKTLGKYKKYLLKKIK